MHENTDKDKKDTQVFINETQMKLDRNKRLGRAKAKRTKATNEQINELREQVALLAQQNQQMLQYLMGNKSKSVAMPKPKQTPAPSVVDHNGDEVKVDNSDIDEKKGFDSNALNGFFEVACSLLEQNKLSRGQAAMFCEKVCFRKLEDRRRFKDDSPVYTEDPPIRLMKYHAYNSLLLDFMKAKQTGTICTMHYTDDPDSMGKAKRTAEQKLESAFNWCVKEQNNVRHNIMWEVRV